MTTTDVMGATLPPENVSGAPRMVENLMKKDKDLSHINLSEEHRRHGGPGSLPGIRHGSSKPDSDARTSAFGQAAESTGTSISSQASEHVSSRSTKDAAPAKGSGAPVDKGFLNGMASPRLSSNPRAEPYDQTGQKSILKMHKFHLYETASRFYLVGSDVTDRKCRVLKIDRTADHGTLTIAADALVYTKKETNELLNTVDDGNKSSGGLKLKASTFGLLGFIRFTGDYYMLLITKRSQVAMIGGHSIYQIDGTELVSLTPTSLARSKPDQHPEEARFISILNNLDLSRHFYFSYSYDITHTLQYNICREKKALLKEAPAQSTKHFNEMFVWNHHLLQPATCVIENVYEWCLPIMHGFVDQAALSIYGRLVYVTIIARRSRLFAGARFLKRGSNDLGYVANDVETEQIVSEMLTTSFHAPGPKLYANPNYTAYVQHRGSIPLYWVQDSTGVTPKPDIELNLVDPFYSAAALHFDNLFERYGAPIIVLNLVKARERTPRESILLKEYTKAIEYLNQFLPDEKKIIYKPWDMSRASKSRDQDVIGTLESIAEDVLRTTSFFHNGDGKTEPIKIQNGVARTNCIDCLDRTNAAQFVIGKLALGHQLHALGIINETSIEYDTDAVNLFTHMYHDHGDTIAIQYGGSHLVNTMETYRKINQWTSHSRDMVESFKRYYNNSFLDGQRQEAYNLFLGNYTFVQGQPMLWDLATDYYLHHSHPRTWSANNRKNYIDWYTPSHLESREMPLLDHLDKSTSKLSLESLDDYWLEYYRPLSLSTFGKNFSYRMNSTMRYAPFRSTQEGKYDLSPFRVRSGHDQEMSEKPIYREGTGIVDVQENNAHEEDRRRAQPTPHTSAVNFPRWAPTESNDLPIKSHNMLSDALLPSWDTPLSPDALPNNTKSTKDKSVIAQWTLNQFVVNSLNPSVTRAEMDEYSRYITHPLNLPLVISTESPPLPSPDLLSYVKSMSANKLSDMHVAEDDIAEYEGFLDVAENPLTVTDADAPKKRYKAYRQWLKGKSLFKQSRVDP